MEPFWGFVLLLVAVAAGLVVLLVHKAVRAHRSARIEEAMDVLLPDLGQERPRPKRRLPEFVDDTAPAVLSVPPEFDHPEWERPKKPSSQRWLH
jgi:hypothetical protein